MYEKMMSSVGSWRFSEGNSFSVTCRSGAAGYLQSEVNVGVKVQRTSSRAAAETELFHHSFIYHHMSQFLSSTLRFI